MKRLFCYLALTFLIPWIIWITLNIMGEYGSTLYMAITALLMFSPLLSALISAKVYDEKVIKYSWKLNFKKNVLCYVLASLLPIVLSILGSVAFYLIFPSAFSFDASQKESILIILAILIPGGIFNSLFAIGEEAGWRGYLYPTLKEKFGKKNALIITGIIWGVWHTPVNIMGYNYGKNYPLFPYLGIIAMCLSCTSLGLFLSYLSERSNSIWPSALFHGSVNASGAIGIMFLNNTRYQVFGPGITALIPSIIMLLLFLLMRKGEKDA